MVRFAIGIGCLLLLCGLIIGALLFAPLAAAQDASLTPTPSATATPTATASPTASATTSETPSITPTAALSDTPTATATSTATLPPTWTPVVQTVIVPQPPIVITVAVPIPIFPTLPPLPQLVLPTSPAPPPQPAPPTDIPTPAFGWTRIESGALIPMIGSWGVVRHAGASARAFRESGSANARLRFPFTGDGIRILLVTHPQGGAFAVELDGQRVGIVHTQSQDEVVSQAGPYFFQPGYHVLDLIALASRSGTTSIRIDAVEVFHGPPLPTPQATLETPLPPPTELPAVGEALSVALLSQPPTPLPTLTPIEAAMLTVDVIVAYDLNRNGVPEPVEGVERLSVRLVDTSTNRLLASGLTDAVGFVRLQAMTSAPVTAFIPFLGEAYDIRRAQRGGVTRWMLLLDAGVQPGLIP